MSIFHGFLSFSQNFPLIFFYNIHITIPHATANTCVEYKKKIGVFVTFLKKISFPTCQAFINDKMQYVRPVCDPLTAKISLNNHSINNHTAFLPWFQLSGLISTIIITFMM